MVASTANSSSHSQDRVHPKRRPRHVIRGGLMAGVAALAAVELYAVAIRAAGIPMKAGFIGAHAASPVTLASFATGIMVCTFWGTVLALVVARYAARPRRTFAAAAVSLAAVSLVVPIGAGATPGETKAVLAAAHILAASIIIPLLTRSLQRPRMGHVGR